MRRGALGAIVTALLLLTAASGAAASGASKLTLKVNGPTIEGVPFKEVAGTETTLTVTGTVKSLPVGAKVSLFEKPSPSAPFKRAASVKVRGGRVTAEIKATTTDSRAYEFVASSRSGKRLATSRAATVVWIAPPSVLGVNFYGEGAELQLPSGKLVCAVGGEAGPDTCEPNGGASSGQTLPGSVLTGLIATPPGSTIVLYVNGVAVCTAHGPNGSCIRVEATLPTVTSTTLVPVTAEYRSPAGAAVRVTALIHVFP